MTGNFTEKDSEAKKAVKDTAMTNEVEHTEDAAEGPAQKKKKKRRHSEAYYDQRNTQDNKDQRKECSRLRKDSIEAPPPRAMSNYQIEAAAEAVKVASQQVSELPSDETPSSSPPPIPIPQISKRISSPMIRMKAYARIISRLVWARPP
ncbi:hypothetical protein PENVUL_c008G06046 [Penicillium vulpinum]|uniref:Uncharacterized protein n=1 Tax=Penicillium vulpinum TaxID=29845 RepID=A0A1V6S502_9EURO|nr:hypothetical protein PENVUL_c008G06046 [Penicillium vulpinum]